MIRIDLASMDHLPSWLELVRDVEPLFGPMPDFATHARRGIERGTALVAAEGIVVHGAALLSRDDPPRRIHWFAVRRESRRQGVGSALMDAILRRWPTGTIEVVTFTADIREGLPARRLYERYDFVCDGTAAPTPDGAPRDRFTRRCRPTSVLDKNREW